MLNVWRCGVSALLGLLCIGLGVIGPDAAAQPATAQSGSMEREVPATPSKRLKYRRGPVCMCNSGLSEQEIEAAERRRRQEAMHEQQNSSDVPGRSD